MSVSVKTKINKIEKIKKNAEKIDDREIAVGVHGEQAYFAAIHEYGINIEVTPKMRAWLHRNGLHLKKSTTHIHIPERSFLRNGYDENIDFFKQQIGLLIPSVVDGSLDSDDFLEIIAPIIRDKIADYATDLSDPPNHPFTIGRKKSSNPLVASGDMINALGFEIR